MRAISAFSFEAGTSTLGWRATMALRTRVSISAIGSLVIRARTSSNQLALTTPGISPDSASWRKHRRQMPYLRRNARGRPQRQQRLRLRHCSFGVFAFWALASLISFAIFAVVAIGFPFLLLLLLPERHAHLLQQRIALGVRARRGGNADVHSLGLLHLRVVDFRENQLIFDAQREVAAAIERARRNAAEVAHTGQGNVHQAVEKFLHPV